MVYKLYYFDSRGIAEPARQLFKLAGKEFEDIRIERNSWTEHKQDTPFGQVPILEVNGTKIAQSAAILRYLAREFGYAGKTSEEQALVDSYFELYKDYMAKARNYYHIILGTATGDAVSLTAHADFVAQQEAYYNEFEPARDEFFGLIEKQLKSNGTGFLVGDSVTYIDLQLADHVSTLLDYLPMILDNFPETIKLKDKVESIPAIAQWLKDRPVTEK